MIKSTIKLLLALAMTVTFGSSFLAQAQNTQSQWEAIFSRASETAVFENGKIVSLKQPIPNESEKTFSFTHSENYNEPQKLDR